MYSVSAMRNRLQWSLKSATRTHRRRPNSIRDIAARLGISPSSVWRILHGQAGQQMAETYGPLVLALLEDRASPGEAPAQPQEQAGLWSTLPPSLTVQQVAYILNCTPQTVRDLSRQGILPHTRLRRQFRIDTGALRLLLARRGVLPLDAVRHLRLEGRRPREATGEGEKA